MMHTYRMDSSFYDCGNDKEKIRQMIDSFRKKQFDKYGFPCKFADRHDMLFDKNEIYPLSQSDISLWFYKNNDFLPCKMNIAEAYADGSMRDLYIDVLVHPADMYYDADIDGVRYEMNNSLAVEYMQADLMPAIYYWQIRELPFSHNYLTVNGDVKKDNDKKQPFSLFIINDSFTAGLLAAYRREH